MTVDEFFGEFPIESPKELTPEAKVELDKFFNLYGTHFILQHLLDE